jgi:ribosomal protein S11
MKENTFEKIIKALEATATKGHQKETSNLFTGSKTILLDKSILRSKPPTGTPSSVKRLPKITRKGRKSWKWPRERVWTEISRKKKRHPEFGRFLKIFHKLTRSKKPRKEVHWAIRTLYTRGKKRFHFPTSTILETPRKRKLTKLVKLKSFRWWKHSRLIQSSYEKLPRHRLLPHWVKPKVKTIFQGIKHKKIPILKARVFKRTIFFVDWKRTRGAKWYLKYPWRMDQATAQEKTEWRLGRIYVTFKHNNTFMTLTAENPSRVHYTTNAGLVGYKGPKKATVFAREHVAKDVSEAAFQKNFLLVDLYLNMVGRVYWYLIKGLNEYNITVRSIIMKKQKAHGFIRPKKERRI